METQELISLPIISSIPPSGENTGFRRIHIDSGENSSDEFKRNAEDVTLLFDALDAVHTWTQPFRTSPLTSEELENSESPRNRSLLTDCVNLDNLFASMRDLILTDDLYALPLEKPEFMSRFQKINRTLSNSHREEKKIFPTQIEITDDTKVSMIDKVHDLLAESIRLSINSLRSITEKHTDKDISLERFVPDIQKLHIMRNNFLNVLHDLNNSITPFRGFMQVQYLHKVTLPEELSNRTIRGVIEKVDSATDQILEQHPLETISVDQIDESIAKHLFLYLPQGITSAGGSLKEYPRAHGLTIQYPRVYFNELLENIAQNCAKSITAEAELHPDNYSLDEKGFVIIDFRIPKENQTLSLIIKDTGKGFPDHIIKNGFDGYSDWGGTSAEGTGIGMKNHVNLLKQYGGTIIPENEYEEGELIGSKLTITFPRTS